MTNDPPYEEQDMRAEWMEHFLTIDEAVARSGYTAQYLRRPALRPARGKGVRPESL